MAARTLLIDDYHLVEPNCRKTAMVMMTPQEKNAAVAVKLGWRVVDLLSGDGKIRGMTKSNCEAEFLGSVTQIPDYCHDIKAAWEIAEKYPFIPDGRCEAWFQLMRRQENEMLPEVKIWEAGWARYDDCMILSEYADTAPMAIVGAFLKL